MLAEQKQLATNELEWLAHRTATIGECGLVRVHMTLLEEVCTVVGLKKKKKKQNTQNKITIIYLILPMKSWEPGAGVENC